MHIAICDDNSIHLATAKNITEDFFEKNPENTVIRTFSPFQFLDVLDSETFSYDIVLLDIELSLESTGIDLARKINKKSSHCQIIYLSNYPKYMMEVYETDHIYFVHKMKLAQVLPTALEKAVKQLASLENRPYLFINSHPDTIRLYLDDFIYGERLQRKTALHTKDCVFTITENTDWLENQCKNYPFIIRCHNSFVVNLKYVRLFNRSHLQLPGNVTIPISRRYLEPTKMAFLQYMQNCL